MHLIAISRLREAAAKYPDVAIQIEDWDEIVNIATWQNLTERSATNLCFCRSRWKFHSIQYQRESLSANCLHQLSQANYLFQIFSHSR
jgi:hypothetical protein